MNENRIDEGLGCPAIAFFPPSDPSFQQSRSPPHTTQASQKINLFSNDYKF